MFTTIQRVLIIFIICLQGVFAVNAQDSTSFNFTNNSKWHFGVGPVLVKDFGQQANYFRGINSSFGIEQLLALPSVKSELLNRTGYNYSLAEIPAPMRYELGFGAAVNVMYEAESVNWILSGSFIQLKTSGYFTLSAVNPSNPFGDDLIRTEVVSGLERRTWIKAGLQTRSPINEKLDFIFEFAPAYYFQKAVKNNVIIENQTYSILVQNPGNIIVRTNFNGIGINLGPGIQTRFANNRFAQFGANLLVDKLKMVDTNKLNYSLNIYLSIFI